MLHPGFDHLNSQGSFAPLGWSWIKSQKVNQDGSVERCLSECQGQRCAVVERCQCCLSRNGAVAGLSMRSWAQGEIKVTFRVWYVAYRQEWPSLKHHEGSKRKRETHGEVKEERGWSGGEKEREREKHKDIGQIVNNQWISHQGSKRGYTALFFHLFCMFKIFQK